MALLSFSSVAYTQPPAGTITLNTTGKPPLNDHNMRGFMDRVAQEAFRRVGIKLKTVQLPAERGLLNANAGIDDGEMSRIAGIQKHYPNLVQVPEKIMQWEFVAIGTSSANTGAGWKSLEGKEVAIINGWKILEANLGTATKVSSPDQLFQMLKLGRTDFVVYERWGAAKYLRDLALEKHRVILPPLAVSDMYIYLHKKHAPLIKPLSIALKKMKADGEYHKIKGQTLNKFVPEES